MRSRTNITYSRKYLRDCVNNSGVVDDGFVTTFIEDQRNRSVPIAERLQRYQQRLSMAVH
jgi:hypothetical protein